MLNFKINNQTVNFETSSDLFSPKGLDIGTKLLIESIAKMNFEDQTLLDWGCGWGAMSLWLGKNYPSCNIIGLDSDIGAIKLARKNVTQNNLNNVEIILSHGYSEIELNSKIQLLVSNPPTHRGREVVEQMIKESSELLNDSGSLAIVVEARLKPWVSKQMQRVFGNCKIEARSKKHVVLMSTKVI